MKTSSNFRRLLLCTIAFGLSSYMLAHLSSGYLVEVRGVAHSADPPTFEGADQPPYGINAALQNEDEESRKRGLDLLRDGGYSWVRQPFPWREIEPAKGHFAWERWDRLVDDYSTRGLRLIAMLDHPPDWSRLDNNWPNRPPDDLTDFSDFVAAFAGRYRGRIQHVQIWDEPNIFPNWGNRPIDPAGYAALLAAAYQSAKAANPTVTVLLAGLAPNIEIGGRNMSDLAFLSALYQSGAGRYFDVAAAKPYGLWYSPTDRTVDPARTNFARVILWRGVMVAHDDGSKPIWAVEFGWNGLPPAWQGRPSLWGSVPAEAQAAYTVAAMQRARQEWPWLPVLVLQGYLPSLPNDDPRSGFSIVDLAGQPKPVFEAVRSMAVTKSLATGFHGASSFAIERTGGWSGSGGVMAGPPGSVMGVPFYGTRLDVVLDKGRHGAVAAVTIDGKPANRLTKVAGLAWLDAASREVRTERVTVSDGLPPGDHYLELRVTGRGELWPRTALSPATLSVRGFWVVNEHAYSFRELSLAGPLLTSLLSLLLLGVLICRLPWGTWLARAFCPIGRLKRLILQTGRRTSAAHRGLSAGQHDLLALLALVGAVLALYEGGALLAAPALLFVVVACWCRPSAAAIALIASAPLVNAPVRIGQASFGVSEILALAATFAVVGHHALQVSLGRRESPPSRFPLFERCVDWGKRGFNAPIALLMLAGLVATIFAGQQREAWRELRTVIFEPAALYILIVSGRALAGARGHYKGFCERLIDTLVIVGIVVSLFGLFQYFFTDDVITAEGVRRLRGMYGSPNNVGLMLGRIIPIAACVAIGDRTRRWYAVALLPLLTATFFTFSVGAWLGLAGAAVFISVLGGRRVALATASGVSAVCIGLVAILPVERILSHLSLQSGTNRIRVLLWQSAGSMVRDHFVLGVGPDNFLSAYRSYALPNAWQEPNLSHPHNLVLDFWLRTGFLGLVAGLWLIAGFLWSGLALYGRLVAPGHRALVLGLLASMVDFVVHGLVDNSFFLVDLALVFWLSYGVLEVLRREHYNSESAR